MRCISISSPGSLFLKGEIKRKIGNQFDGLCETVLFVHICKGYMANSMENWKEEKV